VDCARFEATELGALERRWIGTQLTARAFPCRAVVAREAHARYYQKAGSALMSPRSSGWEG
jgi:hypothetical protein